MACAPVEQAVTTAWFGPLKPKRIETCPEIRLISAPGMKNGLSPASARVSLISTAVSAIELSPPMPEPIITPVRQRASSSGGTQPEIPHRLHRRRHAVEDEVIHLALVFRLHPVVRD